MPEAKRAAGLSTAEVDRLLSLADGNAALVYMYAKRQGLIWPEMLPGLSDEAFLAARQALVSCGLLFPPDPVRDSGERPIYDARQIADCARRDASFRHIVGEAERLLGRTLGSADLEMLYALYDWRGFRPGVLLLLLHYCVDANREKRGAGARPPTLRQIDKEAALWEKAGVTDELSAERHIEYLSGLREKSTEVLRSLGLGESANSVERKYVNDWLGMGFELDAIALAYEKTVTNTGKLSFPYCNKILLNWHAENLHTLAQVEKNGGRKPPQTAKSAAPSRNGVTGVSRTKEALRRIKGE